MGADAPPEVGQEVEEALVIEDEGVLGEEGEVEVSVLGEAVEEVTLISQDLALVGEYYDLFGLALRQEGVLCMAKYPKCKSVRFNTFS